MPSSKPPTQHNIQRKKNPDKQFHTCLICSKKFNHKGHLNSHYWVHLSPDEKRVVKAEWVDKCYFCKKTFRTFSTLREHIAIHTEEKGFKCSTCKKSFNTKAHLTAHLFHHLTPEEKERTMGGWNHPCNLCGKRFKSESLLHRHIISTHTREKHYPCIQCGKAFNHQGNLNKHLRTHSRDPAKRRPFPCGQCHKSFTQKRDLTRHQTTVHFGLKEFQCSQCKKKFSQESSMTVHTKSVHAKIRHPCAHCGKTFSHKGDARKHEKRAH